MKKTEGEMFSRCDSQNSKNIFAENRSLQRYKIASPRPNSRQELPRYPQHAILQGARQPRVRPRSALCRPREEGLQVPARANRAL